jgi:hypothetical protein
MRRFFSSPGNRSILLLVFSAISMLVLFGRAAVVAVNGVIGFSQSGMAVSFLDALGMVCCAGLLFPLLIGSIHQLQGRELPDAHLLPIKGRAFFGLVIIWLIMVAAASVVIELFDFGWLLAAPAFVLAMLIPVAALVWIGAGGLVSGPRRRLWAAFGLGMAGSTGLAVFLEYLVVGVAAIFGAVVVALRPELQTVLQDLRSQITNAGDMEAMLNLLAPYLTNPWVFLIILLFASVLAPLIEECVKPLAVWLLGRNLHSPAEGFALGAVCGAGFALLEGLMASSGMAQVLYFGLPARAASSLMHITLSALMGWGIASAMLEKRYKRLIGAYVLCTSLHGLWNGSALLAVFGSLRFTLQNMTYDPLSILSMAAGFGMLSLIFVTIAIVLPILNRKLRPAQSDIIAPLTSQPERTPNGLDSQSS